MNKVKSYFVKFSRCCARSVFKMPLQPTVLDIALAVFKSRLKNAIYFSQERHFVAKLRCSVKSLSS